MDNKLEVERYWVVARVKDFYTDLTELHLYRSKDECIKMFKHFDEEWKGEGACFPVDYIYKGGGIIEVQPNSWKKN